MNNRFPYNARQNRPPGLHQFNFNQQQQQPHLLNPRAPQFNPHPPTPQQQAPPGFTNNNTGAWNTPGFQHHNQYQPTNTPIPSNIPNHHHSWNSNNPNIPPPRMMIDQNQRESGNFNHQQRQHSPRFYAQNAPPIRPPFVQPPRFAPHFRGEKSAPRLPLPPSNTFQFSVNNSDNQFHPGFVSRPHSPSYPPQQPQHVIDEKEMYKEKMKNTVASWLQGKQFEQSKENSKENDHFLKVLHIKITVLKFMQLMIFHPSFVLLSPC